MGQTRIFIDMDGTLAEFRETDTLETLYEPGYFYHLPPQQNVVMAVRSLLPQFSVGEQMEVYILSAVLSDSKTAIPEKRAWLKRYLPELEADHCIFPPCGIDKSEYLECNCGIKIQSTDVLLDDYTKNLVAWETSGGRAIKLINNINNTRKTWKGEKVLASEQPGNLCEEVVRLCTAFRHEGIATERMASAALALLGWNPIAVSDFTDNEYAWSRAGGSVIIEQDSLRQLCQFVAEEISMQHSHSNINNTSSLTFELTHIPSNTSIQELTPHNVYCFKVDQGFCTHEILMTCNDCILMCPAWENRDGSISFKESSGERVCYSLLSRVHQEATVTLQNVYKNMLSLWEKDADLDVGFSIGSQYVEFSSQYSPLEAMCRLKSIFENHSMMADGRGWSGQCEHDDEDELE